MPYFPPNALTMLGLPQTMQGGPVQAPANLQIGGGGVALPPGQSPQPQQQGGGAGMIDPRVLQGGGFSQVGGMGTTQPQPDNPLRQALQGALQQQMGAGAAAQGMAGQIGGPKQTVSGIYQDLFGRAPDPAGLAYWANQLQTGALTPGNAASVIGGSAQGPDAATFQNNPNRDAALNRWFSTDTSSAPNYTSQIRPLDTSGWQTRINSWGAANTNQTMEKIRAKQASGQPLDVFEQQVLLENPNWGPPAPPPAAAAPMAAPVAQQAPAAPQGTWQGLLGSGDPAMDEWRRRMGGG